MRFDISQTVTQDFLLPPALYAADNTPATFTIGKADALMLSIMTGIGGITFSGVNKIEYVLTHSEDDSVYTAVTDAHMVGVTGITGGIIRSLVAAHAAPSVVRLGYIGGRPFLRLLADFSGTHGTGTTLCVLGTRGRLDRV
jgi:hypothetical protein